MDKNQAKMMSELDSLKYFIRRMITNYEVYNDTIFISNILFMFTSHDNAISFKSGNIMTRTAKELTQKEFNDLIGFIGEEYKITISEIVI